MLQDTDTFLCLHIRSCEGVTITGAEYLLENASLEPSFPLGVSNRHAPGQQMKVSVKTGTLLLIQSRLE